MTEARRTDGSKRVIAANRPMTAKVGQKPPAATQPRRDWFRSGERERHVLPRDDQEMGQAGRPKVIGNLRGLLPGVSENEAGEQRTTVTAQHRSAAKHRPTDHVCHPPKQRRTERNPDSHQLKATAEMASEHPPRDRRRERHQGTGDVHCLTGAATRDGRRRRPPGNREHSLSFDSRGEGHTAGLPLRIAEQRRRTRPPTNRRRMQSRNRTSSENRR